MSVPRVATKVIKAKPSARPIRSMALAVGNLNTPPITLDMIEVTPVRGRSENDDVT